ncbi:MAG: carotenoid biosynthesis protein [Candidatus Planktophila sp.]|nr:carotenoid biosynthesis protein [Candidatus Planktophila sp.]
MSIRHYSPRRNRRRGISRRINIMLVAVLSIAIALQIIYPLIDGEALRVVTMAVIYWGAAAMLLHALLAYGARYAFTYLGFTFAFALITEHIGVITAWPFGEYSYSPDLGFRIFAVPFVVPFAWIMMAHPVLVASRRVAGHWVFLYGGIALAAWDLFLDPLMVTSGRWTWVVKGAHVPFQPEIPLSNTFGWLLSGMALIAILHLILPRDRRKISASFLAVDAFLVWALFSGIVGNLFFFDRPNNALFAGGIFAAVLTPYFFTRWLGRP